MSHIMAKVNNIIRILEDKPRGQPAQPKENLFRGNLQSKHHTQDQQHRAVLKLLLGEPSKNASRRLSVSGNLQSKERQASRSRLTRQSRQASRSASKSMNQSKSAKSEKRTNKQDNQPTRLQRIMRLKVQKPRTRSVVREFLRNSQLCTSNKKQPPLFKELQEEERKARCLSSHFSRLNFEIERESRSLIAKEAKNETLKDQLQKEFERERGKQAAAKSKQAQRQQQTQDRLDKREYYRVMRESKKETQGGGRGRERLQKVREQLKASVSRRIRLQDDISTTLSKIIGRQL